MGWFTGRLPPWQCQSREICTGLAWWRCRLHIVARRYARNFFRAVGLFRVQLSGLCRSNEVVASHYRTSCRETWWQNRNPYIEGPLSPGVNRWRNIVGKIDCWILLYTQRHDGAVPHWKRGFQQGRCQSSASGLLASKYWKRRDDTEGTPILETSGVAKPKALFVLCRIRLGSVRSRFGLSWTTRRNENWRTRRSVQRQCGSQDENWCRPTISLQKVTNRIEKPIPNLRNQSVHTSSCKSQSFHSGQYHSIRIHSLVIQVKLEGHRVRSASDRAEWLHCRFSICTPFAIRCVERSLV